MSKLSPYAFLDQVHKEDTDLLNYYLYTGKYENCPKNNNLINVDIDKMLKKESTYSNQIKLDYKNIYLIKK
jgi:hypothetical protein